MAYGNEAWGGPSEVHRYLSDANVDWGQQLKSVKQYLDENHITNCWFAYFPDGAVEPSDYGVPCKRLPTGSSLWWFRLPMDVPPVIDGTVLISDSDLEGIESGDGPLNWFEPFRGLKPVATIQQGVYVYQGRFAVPLMSALVDVRKTDDLAKAGQPAAALAKAQEAIALAPDSAITQLNLADTLAAQEQWSEATEHYQRAGELARTVRPELEEEDLIPRSKAGMELAQSHLHQP
jgi:tetratricopeptide (TPR) repeat protein